MKKLFATSLILIAIISFAFQKNNSSTPSVSAIVSAIDTTDIDAQMRKLEKEMKVYEEKMKPFEEQMKQVELKMRPLEKQMRDLEKKMHLAANDTEREKVSDEMEAIGKKMEDVGKEMSQYGDKMGEIGEEMGKVGDKMGIIGEQMEIRHKKIFSWFFQELKKDGLITEGKCSIIFEENFFIINGKNLNKEQIQKYKTGLEKQLGKPLKAEFSIYLKGTLDNLSETSYDFNGMMNSDY